MQIQTKIKYHYTPIRLAKFLSLKIYSITEDVQTAAGAIIRY